MKILAHGIVCNKGKDLAKNKRIKGEKERERVGLLVSKSETVFAASSWATKTD